MLRDIHQLLDAPHFASVAVEGLSTAEMALKQAIKYVPYCPEHFKVWSPQFAQIILDCASQLDSLWAAVEGIMDPSTANKQLRIKDHRSRFGKLVACQKVVFFGSEIPAVVEPFSAWLGSTATNPSWWEAYNKLKHNRFGNLQQATLQHALGATAGLLLAIVYSGVCDLALISANLLDTSKRGYNPWAFTNTGLLRDLPFDCRTIVDTRLFAHPFGVFGISNCNLSKWWESRSERFNVWWALNAAEYSTTLSINEHADQ